MLLLFKPNYTIKPCDSHDTSRLNLKFLWKAGINASTYDVPNTFEQSYDFQRRQILRVILILVSNHIYREPN